MQPKADLFFRVIWLVLLHHLAKQRNMEIASSNWSAELCFHLC